MVHYTNPSLVAIATGIVGSAWASGSIASFTLFSSPAARAVPQTSAQVWTELYSRGANIMPKVAATVALAYAYAAYRTKALGGNWTGFAAAAVAVLSVVPFTVFVMRPTNITLHKAAKDDQLLTKEGLVRVLGKWEALNLVRSSLPLVGSVVGGLTFLRNTI